MRMWKCLVFEIREHGGLRVYDKDWWWLAYSFWNIVCLLEFACVMNVMISTDL
jgi:hypothetical protein